MLIDVFALCVFNSSCHMFGLKRAVAVSAVNVVITAFTIGSSMPRTSTIIAVILVLRTVTSFCFAG